MKRHIAEFVAALYKPVEHVAYPVTLLLVAMTSRENTNKRSTTDVATTAAKRRRKRSLPTFEVEQQLLPDTSLSYRDICTYWAAYPAFDP